MDIHIQHSDLDNKINAPLVYLKINKELFFKIMSYLITIDSFYFFLKERFNFYFYFKNGQISFSFILQRTKVKIHPKPPDKTRICDTSQFEWVPSQLN